MPDLLTISGLSKSFGAHVVLRDVGFSVGRGEIVGLLGPNGCGKSTLLNTLSGFLRPDAGEVRLGGTPITGLPAHRIAGAGLLRTFQLPMMPHRMTVWEVLLAGGRERAGLGSVFRRQKERDEEAEELLRRFALEPVRNLPASALSGGQKKLLSIAVALRAWPGLLCLDEPTAGVHPALRQRMVGILKACNAAGLSLLVVEHDMQFVRELCDRCIVLDRGELIADCAPGKLADNARVVEAYLGQAAAKREGVTA